MAPGGTPPPGHLRAGRTRSPWTRTRPDAPLAPLERGSALETGSARDRGQAQRAPGEPAGAATQLTGHPAQRDRGGGVGVGEHDGDTSVPALPEPDVERQLTQERHGGAD